MPGTAGALAMIVLPLPISFPEAFDCWLSIIPFTLLKNPDRKFDRKMRLPSRRFIDPGHRLLLHRG
jgi:hypothetical protein